MNNGYWNELYWQGSYWPETYQYWQDVTDAPPLKGTVMRLDSRIYQIIEVKSEFDD